MRTIENLQQQAQTLKQRPGLNPKIHVFCVIRQNSALTFLPVTVDNFANLSNFDNVTKFDNFKFHYYGQY